MCKGTKIMIEATVIMVEVFEACPVTSTHNYWFGATVYPEDSEDITDRCVAYDIVNELYKDLKADYEGVTLACLLPKEVLYVVVIDGAPKVVARFAYSERYNRFVFTAMHNEPGVAPRF